MTCPCGDAAKGTCAACHRCLCFWHGVANFAGETVCLPSCTSPYWRGATSYDAVMSEVAARPVRDARGEA